MEDMFTEETVEEETAPPHLGGGRPKAAEAGSERDKMPQPQEGDKTEHGEDSRCWIG